MQVSVENVGKLERKLTVRIPAGDYESQVKARLAEVARNVRLKGFRPGKIPPKVIEQRFGSQVRGEAISELIRTSFQEAVGQQNLRPAMAPEINTTGEPADGQIEYTATFEVLPDVGQVDVAKLAISRPVAQVADGDVDAMIETLRQQRRAWTPVERAAQTGDMILFEYTAQAGDVRHPAEGADRSGTILGSGAMTAELEQQLVGHALGEQLTFEMTFPANFRVTALAGQPAHVDVRISRIQESRLPEVDAAFIAMFGIQDGGMDKFRADVRANLERELKGVLTQRLKGDVVQKLVDAYPGLELPQRMVDNEARALAEQAKAQAAQQGQVTVATLPDSFLIMARRRVAAGVLVGEIARQNGVRLDNRRVAEALASIASTYEEPQQVVELYQRDPNLMSSLQNRVLEDQVADWIAEHAQTTEQQLTFNEAMRPNG
ncbi:MAG TPA: trigger factor [Rudaea sp.]|jgi:trigger factor